MCTLRAKIEFFILHFTTSSTLEFTNIPQGGVTLTPPPTFRDFHKVATSDNVKRNGYFDDALPAGLSAPPQLVAQLEGNGLALTWPECPSARLEGAGSLTAPMTWTTITNGITLSGGQKRVTLTPAGDAGYFRLVLD